MLMRPFFVIVVSLVFIITTTLLRASDAGKESICYDNNMKFAEEGLYCILYENEDFAHIDVNVTHLAINFVENNYVEWKRNLFPSLADLSLLQIDITNVDQLAAGSLRLLTSLKTLTIYQNIPEGKEFIVQGSFEGLHKLHNLNIAQLGLHSLNNGSLSHLSSLSSLDLSGNFFNSLPRGVLCDVTALRTLLLYKNKIHKTSDIAFECLQQLRVLDLISNQLVELEANAFAAVPHLQQLNLEFNAISYIHPEAFNKLVRLEHLFLGFNKLTSLDISCLVPFTSLTILELQNNQIADISGQHSNDSLLTNLVTINLNHNRLNTLTSAFQTFHYAKEVMLAENVIDSLGKDFNQFASLTTVDLHSNGLHRINDNAFSQVVSLRHVDLRNNQLNSLPQSAFFLQPFLVQTLKLENNAWHCDCNFSWVGEQLFNLYNDDISLVDDVLCATSPSELTNVSLSYITSSGLFDNCTSTVYDKTSLPSYNCCLSINDTLVMPTMQKDTLVYILVISASLAVVIATGIAISIYIAYVRRKRFVWEKPNNFSPPPTPTTRNVSLVNSSPTKGFQWPPSSTGVTPTKPLLAPHEKS